VLLQGYDQAGRGPNHYLHVVLYALGLDALLAKGQAQMKLSFTLKSLLLLE
jgi:hypothetical protein